MKLSLLLLLSCLLLGCATRHPIEDAKVIAKSHEAFAKAGNLDSVMSNFADDFVGLVPGMPLIKGKDSARRFYGGVLSTTKSEFVHEYDGADIVGDAVSLHGTAKGTLTKPDSTVAPFVNNFMMVLKYQPDGRMKFWRAAFAPRSP